MIYHNPESRPYGYMFVRINPGNISEKIGFLGRTAVKYNPGFPFEYHFLDDDYDLMFRSVEREMGIIQTFAELTVGFQAVKASRSDPITSLHYE
ncbi:MAG: hypothetical protein KJ727_10205 [Acidobacteria bacterium]|nr:hypothetical protein [Acidobacteriota bacterium]MCG2815344.1 hypothetical protein [Candidatus Aminicenantes bacterium]